MTTQEYIDAAIWLQQDAAYLYAQARDKQAIDSITSTWLACRNQEAAAHSSKLARQLMGIESA